MEVIFITIFNYVSNTIKEKEKIKVEKYKLNNNKNHEKKITVSFETKKQRLLNYLLLTLYFVSEQFFQKALCVTIKTLITFSLYKFALIITFFTQSKMFVCLLILN